MPRAWIILCALAASSLPAPPLAAAPSDPPTVGSDRLALVAKATPSGQRVRVAGVEVPSTREVLDLDMERFEVFARDAQILIHGEGGTRRRRVPATTFLRGEVREEPGSRAFLAVLANGRVQGVVTRPGDDHFLVDSAPDGVAAGDTGGRLRAERTSSAILGPEGEPWSCQNGALPPPPEVPGLAALDEALATPGGDPTATMAALVAHTARVAIETDYEFLQLFGGNATDAITYVGNLLGYASTIYEREISTNLLVQSVSLWSTQADPWEQTTTRCGLMEFGRYWNRNRGGQTRTVAHFLSGKSLGGGIAWLGVLCRGAFAVNNVSCPGLATDAPWGGAYGFTAGLSGGFDVNSPRVMWDIVAVAHEIGHNFNSPHTHCYNGIGGSASPIDQCYSGEGGCYSGTRSLPGPAGSGSGTLMSYCHLVRSSFSDVSLSFGTGHPHGIQPGRVPSRMASHVAAVASSNPACLAPDGGSALFTDGFEGNQLPGNWGAVIP